jgi:hypothetical protein
MARTRKSAKSVELGPQPDPRAALDVAGFLTAAQGVLDLLTKDLLARADESPEITAALKARHAHDRAQNRTAETYAVWRREQVVQIAASWLLSCVFVRTLEDRSLLSRNRLTGPGAVDAERAFTLLAPHLGPRDYLLTIFSELDHFPAARRLFDREHNLAWRLAPSNEGAKALLGLFRAGDAEQPYFRFGQASTRFLGDLYQDLSEDVRKRYALLQTPDFVEAYILDRTLEPAIAEFGLRFTNVIDPTCGSGHFLLGAFERLYDRWCGAEPGESNARHVELALRAVAGADINPYAAFIAEFRLTLAAIEKLGVEKLRDAPELPINVVVADSLLHGRGKGQAGFGDLLGQEARVWSGEEFAVEDEGAAKRVLGGEYAAVVGNPPYITVKDKALREIYRERYKSAAGKYALSAPFAERFFEIAREGGFVGQITSNSFMKREFGKALVQEVLPKVDLFSIVNTSGAYIPGHGTPTVILFGRHRAPVGDKVHAVLARRGEPSTPEIPAEGLVWSAIRDHGQEIGYEDDYVTVAEVERTTLNVHPWSLEGGGAGSLKALLEDRAENTLGNMAQDIGFASFPGLDDLFLQPIGVAFRFEIPATMVRPIVVGESVRDWAFLQAEESLCPYSIKTHEPLPLDQEPAFARFAWPYRTTASSVSSFGGKTRAQEGQDWWTWYRWQTERYRAPFRISFAEVATHNHFVLDRGGKVFKQTAPIVKLPETATEDDHLALLAYLNSSTVCFWMKQVAYPKGMHNGSDANATPFLVRYAFDGTKLGRCPIPQPVLEGDLRTRLIDYAREIERISQSIDNLDFAHIIADPSATLASYSAKRERLRERLVGLQEAIDFTVYQAFGFVEVDLSPPKDAHIPIGMRPFEILIARGQGDSADQTWFDWLQVEPRDDLSLLPDALREWTTRVIEHTTSKNARKLGLHLLEAGSSKRRWRQPAGKAAQELETDAKILVDQGRQWLRDRVEATVESHQAILRARDVVDALANDATWQRALALLDLDAKSVIEGALAEESIPHLSTLRFTESGLEKHAAWQHTWSLQRREDAGEKIPEIPVPPKYDQKDFRDATYWRLRGKLDVPKERFIAYPGLESDHDGAPIYGWAGWNHAQRAEALLALYNQRKDTEAWSTERLTPILVGIHELLPWIAQWHNEPDDDTGERLGDAFRDWLGEELRAHGLTPADLDAYRPPTKAGARGKPKASKSAAAKPAGRKRKSAKQADGD